ncbi:MAG TPA: hypothetical protein VK666_07310 [Chryseolinea sp.]|nr:hypothetical protein [Chryseolinea sp.]
MTTFTANQIEEINAIIKAIESKIKPKSEIGAKDKVVLTSLLLTNKVKGKPEYFKCKREYSDAIVTYFVKEKGLAKNRFSSNAQTSIYII